MDYSDLKSNKNDELQTSNDNSSLTISKFFKKKSEDELNVFKEKYSDNK